MIRTKIEAIIVAAGRGERLTPPLRAGAGSKPFIKIGRKPILYHTLKVFCLCPLIKNIILVTKDCDIKRVKRLIIDKNLKKIKKIVGGGETRRLSVEKGLNFIDKDTDLILIHDAVRPFIEQDILKRVILQAEKSGAVVVGVPLKSTVKRVEEKKRFIEETLDRNRIWEIQTPQVFKREFIFKAYENFKGDFSDDSQMVERLGIRVKVVRGNYFNIKITTPEDLAFAEAILRLIGSR